MIRAGLRVLSAALLTLAGLAVTSCGDAPAAPSRAAATTGFEGSWTGSTADGSSIAFTVSSDQRVVAITVGYAFNGCRGTRSFDHLDIRLAPGRSPLTGLSFFYPGETPDGSNLTFVFGSFRSNNSAIGTAAFIQYSGCGDGGGAWTATKN